MLYFVAAFMATLGFMAAVAAGPIIATVLKAAAIVALIVIIAATVWVWRRL